MYRLVFLDTETTGVDPLVDRLFQVAYKFEGELVSKYFKPPLPISVKSMSISHVTNKDIEGKEEFSTSETKQRLQEILKEAILVAHNAWFDVDILSKEGVRAERFIDTLKVIKFLDEENLIPEYGLQYLRYFLGIEIEARAHEAEGDVLVLEKLFEYLYQRMLLQYKDGNIVIEKMLEISQKPLLLRMFNYGKHKGKKVEEVLSYDRSYLEWMLEQKLNNDYFDEDWIYTLKYHLKVD